MKMSDVKSVDSFDLKWSLMISWSFIMLFCDLLLILLYHILLNKYILFIIYWGLFFFKCFVNGELVVSYVYGIFSFQIFVGLVLQGRTCIVTCFGFSVSFLWWLKVKSVVSADRGNGDSVSIFCWIFWIFISGV